VIKLRGYLKPFILSLVLAVALLFVQAICELNLPNLMSDIVNVGIQQGGVEDCTPRVLSKEARIFAQTFMSPQDKKLVDSSYALVKAAEKDASGRPWSETYPNAGDELYVLDDKISAEDLEGLDEVFGTVTWTMLNTFMTLSDMQKAGTLESTLTEQLKARAVEQIIEKIDSGEIPLPPGASKQDFAAALFEQQAASQDTGDAKEAFEGLSGLFGNADGEDGGASADEGSGSRGGSNGQGGQGGSEDGQPSEVDIRSLDIAKIYEAQPLLDLLPADIITSAREDAQGMDPMLRRQSATMLAGSFYRELGQDMAGYEVGYILRIGLIMLAVTLASGVATVLVGFFSARIGAGVARNLRRDIFAKVTQFSHTEINRFSTASLITRSTNDVTQIQMMLAMGIRFIFYAPILAIGATFMALQESVSMSWIIGLAVLVLLCVVGVLMAVVMPKFQIIQKLIDRLNQVAREALNGLMVIRAFGRSEFERGRFETANRDVYKTNLFIQRAMTLMMPVMMVFMNGVTVLIIWVGAHEVAASNMQVGDMMAYMQYAMQVVMGFMFIAMAFIFIPRASVSAKRIAEILQTEPVIHDPEQPLEMDPGQRGRVEFRNVDFRFEGAAHRALSDISFVARPGQTVAFIGSTGSGKSTILSLIERFYDVSAGEVLVGGVDVRQLAQHDLRAQIGYVPQKSALMSGTIADNIRYGDDDLTDDEVRRAAEVAQAADFIEAREEGYGFEVAQGGANVSGGQRQRLSIARALAVKPSIFLFDDSFSALDFKTDAALRHALAQHTRESTLIIVAQRVSTIMDADMIHVVDDGRIVGSGTHAELVRNCPQYYEIASSQLSEEELR
jgi:ATP-binding cassette subfamily B protein